MNNVALSKDEWAARINAAWSRMNGTRRPKREQKKRGEGVETKNVEVPLANFLKEMGHHVQRQIPCPGGKIDIIDFTTEELIECKARGNARSLFDAAVQLKHYEKFYSGYRLTIAIPAMESENEWFAEALRSAGFHILGVERFCHAVNSK